MIIYRLGLFLVLIFMLTSCDVDKNNEVKRLNKTHCETNLPCTFANGVKVWLSNEVLSPEMPFTIFSDLPPQLRIKNAKLEGVTMYMGYIPQQFKKQGDIWQSQTMVGICSEKNMLWNLVLTVENKTTSLEQTLNYYFYVIY